MVAGSLLDGKRSTLVRVVDSSRRAHARPEAGNGLLWTLLLGGAAACSWSQTSSTNRYDVGGVGLGVAVGEAVVYRAATGNCYAQCGRGYACDRKTGLCVRIECAPGCPVGQQCVRELDGSARCAADHGAFTLGGRPRPDAGTATGSADDDADASIDPDAAGPAANEDAGAGARGTDGAAGEGAMLEAGSPR